MNSSEKLMNVSSRQLMVFLEICRLQSFARAAELVHLSPSGISMLIKELEQQVGARLFERTTRALSLTDAGKQLQPVAERVVQELRELQSVVQGTQAAARQRLEIAATPTVSASLLPLVLSEFALHQPQVRVNLIDVDVTEVRRRVLDGSADMGLGFFVKPAVGLLRQPLCKFRLMLISPPDLAATPNPANGLLKSRAWHTLTDLPLVSLPLDNPIQAVIEKHLAKIGITARERLCVNLIGTILAMVRAGRGHAVIPSFALDECLRLGLGVSMLRSPVAYMELFLISRRGMYATPVISEFSAVLQRTAANLAV